MLIRALIVLLVVLNLGVAGWWISRPAAVAPAPPPQPQGVPLLQLASEAPPPAAAADAAPAETAEEPPAEPAAAIAAPTTSATAPALQCFSLGSFANADAAAAAIARLGARAVRSAVREARPVVKGGYTVFLPPAENHEAAQALARRIADAGFSDLAVIREGEQANGIALGLYRNREGAERRRAALEAAGFPAQLRGAGEEAPSQWWIDVAVERGGLRIAQARTQAGAGQSRPLDCAALR